MKIGAAVKLVKRIATLDPSRVEVLGHGSNGPVCQFCRGIGYERTDSIEHNEGCVWVEACELAPSATTLPTHAGAGVVRH